HVRQQEQRRPSQEVERRQWAAATESITDPSGSNRPSDVHRAHYAERHRCLNLCEAVLERVRHEMGQDHSDGGVPASELRGHQQPELRSSKGIRERDASGALLRGGLDRCAEWPAGTVWLESALLRFVSNESGDHWEDEPE